MALVNIGAEFSLVYGKPEQFPSPSAYIDGQDSQIIQIQSVSCHVDWVEQYMKSVSYDVLLTSDSLADLEQCEHIWDHVGGL